jgi:hypothetical protein
MGEDRQHLKDKRVTPAQITQALGALEPTISGTSPSIHEYEESEIQAQLLAVDLEKLQLKNRELMDIILLRRIWSIVFLVILILIVAFEVVLTVLVGARLLQFDDDWFLRIIILGGIAQIIAMPVLVTQFLFNTKHQMSQGN